MEKSTDATYNVDVGTTTAEVKYSKDFGDTNITITNSKKTGFIEINKYDADNNTIKLKGAKFGIYDTNNNLIETLTTNANGYCKSSALEIDKKFIVRELEAPENYVINETKWTINLTENGIVDKFVYTLNVPNKYKTGNLVIHKVDAEDNTVVIPNTEFQVYDSKNNLIATIKTDSTGVARLNNIKIRNI